MSKAILWLRRIVALVVFAAFVALFAGLPWMYARHVAPLAKVQFFPALGASLAIFAALVAVTVLFGRWYCSVLCPLGIFQDVAFMLKPHAAQGAKPKARQVVRLAALVAFVALALAGLGVAWFEPYGLFGRIMTIPFVAATLGVVIFALAVWRGRVWCNWICPVGTMLGALAFVAPFRLRIDKAKCIGCKKCERSCRASAISIGAKGEGGRIDQTLCVQCRDCAAMCPKGAISCRAQKSAAAQPAEQQKPDAAKSAEMTRREFIVGSAVTAATLAAEATEKTVDGGFAPVSEPGIDTRNASLKPAGSHSIKNFQTKCVGCQLCVRECPNHVLRPSVRLRDFGQPEMAFDKGFCTTDCSRCAQVCPAGAIEPYAPETKKENIHIGEAVWHKDRCLAASQGVNCNACFRHCPVNAIARVKGDGGALIPVVDQDKCIGCGACEHVCPARPMPAMTVRAYEVHREIRPERPDAALDEAKILIANEGYSCVVIKNGTIVEREKGGGVSPLLRLLDEKPDSLKGATVVDKVIGRAAAAICVVAGVKDVVALTVSEEAEAFLAANSIPCSAGATVPKILNRDKSDSCPLEAACRDLSSPQEMVDAVRKKMASFKK